MTGDQFLAYLAAKHFLQDQAILGSLSGSSDTKVVCKKIDFRSCVFDGFCMEKFTFVECNFKGCDFGGSIVSNVTFKNCDIDNAAFADLAIDSV